MTVPLRLSDFEYSLPQERIAQHPLKRRDDSKLLILHRESGRMEHRPFRDLPGYLRPADLLVLNDTRVVAARLLGRRSTGGKLEVVLLNRIAPQTYEALLNPSAKLPTGSPLLFDNGFAAQVIGGNGTIKTIRFRQGRVGAWVEQKGLVPLPPYIRRPPGREDVRRYQTVYAKKDGAVAAPTAGLHFTKNLLREIARKGVWICSVTLHVGYGTFEPVREEEVSQHNMREEYFEISGKTCRLLNETRRRGGRIVAVGTTSCRVLETSVQRSLAGLPSLAARSGCAPSLAGSKNTPQLNGAFERRIFDRRFGNPRQASDSCVSWSNQALWKPQPFALSSTSAGRRGHGAPGLHCGRATAEEPSMPNLAGVWHALLRKAKGERLPMFCPTKGWTELFIYPPYEFSGTDALLTNFHLPKSTLLMLVSAFAGMDLTRRAYQEAIERGYRFYSYGDAMLIL